VSRKIGVPDLTANYLLKKGERSAFGLKFKTLTTVKALQKQLIFANPPKII
jgi:hypothetical protein